MKKLIFIHVIIFLSVFSSLNAQNLLSDAESGFEFATFTDCPNQINPCEFCPKNNNFNPHDMTGGWASATASPHLEGKSGCYAGTPHKGNLYAYMDGPPDNRVEGIFIPVSFSSSKYYTISFWAYNGSRINLKLINGLAPNDIEINVNSIGISFPPSATDFITLFDDVLVTASGWSRFEIAINPTHNFSQLYFHATKDAVAHTELKIDDVSVVVSCCEKQAIYQNITDPPSTNRIELIEAGKNVDSTKTQGLVTFTKPWQTIWQVGQLDSSGVLHGEIVLKDGFESGKNFLAHLEDCFQAPLRATLSYTVTANTDAQLNCQIKLNTVICFGSGKYSVACKNLNTGAIITSASPIDHGTAFNVFPSVETEYEITVIDLDRGDTTTERITIGRCGCIPPKDVPGVKKNNNICGISISPDCFTIGKELQTNTSFRWKTDFPSGLSFISDTNKSVTTVCIPTSVAGTGYITFQLISSSPGCGPDTSVFTIYYKRDLSNRNGCFLYNGLFGGNQDYDGTGSQNITAGLGVDLDVDSVKLTFTNNGNPLDKQIFYWVRGVDFLPSLTYTLFSHYFNGSLVLHDTYTMRIDYKCRCGTVWNWTGSDRPFFVYQ